MIAGIHSLWTRPEGAQSPVSASKKWSNRVAGWLISLLGIALGCLALNGRTAGKKVEELQSQMRQQGLPATVREFSDWYAKRPFDERKTAAYSKAFLGLSSTNEAETGYLLMTHYTLDDPALFAAKNQAVVASLLVKNAPVLQALHAAPSAEGVRYPLELDYSPYFEMPHIPRIIECARLLFLESVYAAKAGQTSNSVAAILTLFKLGNTLANEPVGKSQGTRAYCNARAVTALEYLINQRPLSLDQLRHLRRAITGVRQTTDISGALLGELCSGVGTSQRLVYKRITGKTDGSFDLEFMSLVLLATSRENPDKLYFLETMRSCLDAAKLPYPERHESFTAISDRYDEHAKRRFYFVSAINLMWVANMFPMDAANHAHLLVADTVLAIEEQRAQGKGLPTTLGAVLHDAPLDPFDGEPLRYVRGKFGYYVYSVGKDGKDNGGATEQHWQNYHAGTDISCRILR
jgi:hypothetical protein